MIASRCVCCGEQREVLADPDARDGSSRSCRTRRGSPRGRRAWGPRCRAGWARPTGRSGCTTSPGRTPAASDRLSAPAPRPTRVEPRQPRPVNASPPALAHGAPRRPDGTRRNRFVTHSWRRPGPGRAGPRTFNFHDKKHASCPECIGRRAVCPPGGASGPESS